MGFDPSFGQLKLFKDIATAKSVSKGAEANGISSAHHGQSRRSRPRPASINTPAMIATAPASRPSAC